MRWWPLILIVLGMAGFIAWNGLVRDVQRQDKNLAATVAGLVTLLLALFWCLFFSRMRWRFRLLTVGLFLAFTLLLASLVKFRGVSGDLVPIFEWRWDAAMAEIQPVSPVVNTNGAAAIGQLVVADFPQFLGPDRNAILGGPALARDWSERAPRLLWRHAIGAAWSGFAIADRYAVTLEQDEAEEVVACYHLVTGEPVWHHRYEARYDTPIGGLGPRTVPTIVGSRVYSLGATGFLTCVELATGERHWSRNIRENTDAGVPSWGFAGSPLHYAGKIIVSVGGSKGGSLVAYDAETGEILWRGGDAGASYSSPFAARLGGVDQVLIFNQPCISAHDMLTGAVLWEYPWNTSQPHVAVPVVTGDETVLFSSGYGVGAELLRVSRDDTGGWSAQQVWKSLRMKAKFANMIRQGDFLYGLDDGILACVDLKDGSRRWKEGRYGHGQMLLVGNLMLITAESGEVILFEPNPDEPRELGRLRAFDHKQWNPPALAGQLLLVRTDREAACYQLPLAASDNATVGKEAGGGTGN